jgi:mannose-1-phosphate guanylyltransferase
VTEHAYAVIMAGGAGTRLWPLSRRARPKPLLPLIEGGRSMFQMAVDRLDPLLPPERVLVVASTDLIPALREQAPALPDENFIVEPMGRDTAPAVGLGAVHVLARDPDAVMAVLTADHHIADTARFLQVLGAAIDLAGEGAVVTLGITPTYPATGFGYIERGEPLREINGVEVAPLVQFREKPDTETAVEYIDNGRFSWNSGMFIWPARRVMDEFAAHAPDIHATLSELRAAIGTPEYDATLARLWPEVRRISVDYALLEHIDEEIYVIPVEMGWHDIGNFSTLYAILSDGEANVVRGDAPALIDTRGSLVISDRLVATIGLDDVVIVDTEDALLVCRRDRAQDVKQIVERLREEQRDSYL